MESLKEQDERAVGERFIEWLNAQYGLSYSFARRAGEAPDLVYTLPDKTELFVEVTSAYYGQEYAEFIWDGARKPSDQPFVGESGDLHAKLAADIVRAVVKKCAKRYERHCILVVSVTSFWTPAKMLIQMLTQQQFPQNNFAGIYVHGRFMPLEPGGEYIMIPIKQYEKILSGK